MDAHGLAVALHARRRVHRVAEQAVVRHLEPDDGAHHGARVHAHPDLQAQAAAGDEAARALDHVQAHVGDGAGAGHRGRSVRHAARAHECVADGLHLHTHTHQRDGEGDTVGDTVRETQWETL